MTKIDVSKKIAEYRELKAMADELEDAIEVIKSELRDYMVDNGFEEDTGVDYRMTCKIVESSRIDSKALMKELPEVAQRYTKVSSSVRLTVH